MMREVSQWVRLAVVFCAGAAAGACSISMPIASLVEDRAATGSVKAKAVSPLSDELGAEDWRRARGALAIALDPQSNGSPVSWDNPETGMAGKLVPGGKPYVRGDEICRSFRATVVGQATTSALQGTACRPSGGEWAIKSVKPAKKPG